ncbi:hypothetical protein C1Y41_06980 [Pantoea sp. ICBG 1758]|uniref:hypothetical protein n=1 Tax=Pantoea sp. ICBG 1758 TaxID=2071682 RepID=UPI000CE558F6|nr:hypothetical protein [Pantoea sp. ICBG 1758]PPC64367.1 hypothetical protein C1Y41_06980 [Pantoea sp. ICBG 1758]
MKKILNVRVDVWFLSVLCLVLIATTKNVYMLNTGDFHRAIFPFMPPIPSFKHDMSLKYPLYEEFWGIGKYAYRSTYSYILYFVAEAFKLVTDQMDTRILSAILKSAYVVILFTLYKKISANKVVIIDYLAFALLAAFMCSSSNIAFFPSFYQEQVLLICMPVMVICLMQRENSLSTIFAFAISAFIIGGSKSQFFYLPICSLVFIFYFKNYKKTLAASLLMAQIFTIAFVLHSSGATNYNKYHSAYYGIYAFEKMNGIDLPDSVDDKCIGIDAWGGQLDKERGSHRSAFGESCYNNNRDTSFMDSIKEYIRHPSIIFKLPFDSIVRDNLVTDYIHVAKTIKVIIDDKSSWSSKMTHIKDDVFSIYRMAIMVALMLAFVAVRAIRSMSIPIAFIGIFGISQFYISFLGEGYRDLSKHLFGVSFSFDLMLFVAISFCLAKALKKPR